MKITRRTLAAAKRYNVTLDMFQTQEEWRRFCKRKNDELHGGMKKRYAADPEKFQKRAAMRYSTLSEKRRELRRRLKGGGGISLCERIIHTIMAARVSAANIISSYCPKLEGGDVEAAGQKRIFIDFYLPEHGIAIEYDGPHHFGKAFYLNRKGDASRVIIEQEESRIKHRDAFLLDWCNRNGIKLYRLSHEHWEMRNKGIQKTLNYILPKILDKSIESDEKGYILPPHFTTADEIAIDRLEDPLLTDTYTSGV